MTFIPYLAKDNSPTPGTLTVMEAAHASADRVAG
jgi:hypothetical protein